MNAFPAPEARETPPWHLVFDAALDATMLVTRDGRIIAANPQACTLTGHTEGELLTAGRDGVVVANECFRRFLEERDRAGRARAVLTLRRRDGTTLLADVAAAAFTSPRGEKLVTLNLRDVTEAERNRRTLEILAEAGKFLGTSLDQQATLDGLTSLVVPRLADACVVDLFEGGEVKRVAAAHRDPTKAAQLIALRRPQARHLGSSVDAVLRTGEPAVVERVTDEWLRRITEDEEQLRAVRALGVRSAISAPLMARGKTLGALSLVSLGETPEFTRADLVLVTALAGRAALALDNARQYREAVDARRMREEVLATVTHDLRAPLNAVLLTAGVLERRGASPELDRIKASVRRADRLIEDLLTASKVEGGRLALDLELESCAALVNEVLEAHRAEALAHELELTGTCDDAAGKVRADHHRVVQLLGNLVANALKFTGHGGRVTLSARADADAVVFSVTDTGRGIAPEDLPHVFDRFWQGAHTRQAGAGLGLAIARGIAEAHGGTLSVASTPGVGSTFRFRLPRR